MNDQPTMLGRQLVQKALSDPKFFDVVPEFRTIQPKIKTLQLNVPGKSGCCGDYTARRVESTLLRDFVFVLTALPPASLERFKQYLGTKRLMLTVQNPTNGAYETKLL